MSKDNYEFKYLFVQVSDFLRKKKCKRFVECIKRMKQLLFGCK